MKKKILSLTLATFILLTVTAVAFADGLYIASASCGITESGVGQVSASQYTRTNTTATKIKHVKYIQRLVGGSWQTYTTVTSYSYGTSTFSDSAVRIVARNYYYRVVTYHYAYSGNTVVDIEVRTSGSVYVD